VLKVSPSANPPTPPPVPGRWGMLGVLFLATFLAYLDRQALSVAIEPISQEFGLDPVMRGRVLSIFVFVYAACLPLGGLLADRVANLRWFYPCMVLGWSLATLAIGLVHTTGQLLLVRSLLGVFECVHFPVCLMLLARIFPPGMRALASGIFTSGAVLATLIAPKLVIFLSLRFDWRVAFLVCGGMAVLWIPLWMRVFSKDSPVLHNASGFGGKELRGDLRAISRRKVFWAAMAIGMGTVPAQYFASQWLPSYFTLQWKVPYTQALGDRLVFIYLLQDAGLWLGGGMAAWLAARGVEPLTARRRVILVGYLIAMSMLLIPQVHTPQAAFWVVAMYVFGIGCWSANNGAFKQEVFPARVGLATALIGAVETGCAALLVDRVGKIAESTGGFGAVFALMAAVLTMAVVLVFVFWRREVFEPSDRVPGS
jgi:MFS transporter, ACS family, hexuronate transporter